MPAFSCLGGEDLLTRLFEALWYAVSASGPLIDDTFPQWGLSPYLTVRLEGTHRLADALQHLYVLIPTLDDEKHYWIGRNEVDKLMNRGGEWLARHPQRDLIISRYLKGLRTFTSEALERLTEEESADGASRAEG